MLPFGVGVLLTLQLMMLGFKLTMPTKLHFGGNGFVIWLPTHLMYVRLMMFLFLTETRAVHEKVNVVKNRAEENEFMLSADFIEREQGANRIFAMKMTGVYLVIFWESLRESLTKYDISVWVTFGIAMGVTMMFAAEGLSKGVAWWPDQRHITRKKFQEMEEDSDGI